MSHSNIDKEEIEEEEMEEEEYEEELREKIKNLLIAVRAILQVLQELMVNMYNNQVHILYLDDQKRQLDTIMYTEY